MDHQLETVALRQLVRPADDELLGILVEITVKERRGIHRIEQLGEIAQLQIDLRGMMRSGHVYRVKILALKSIAPTRVIMLEG